MNFTLFLFSVLFIYSNTQAYECPNYEAYKNYKKLKTSNNGKMEVPMPCNFRLINPKKVINKYLNDIQNYVESKPFASICLKCSMCLSVAKEMDQIFQEISSSNREIKQDEVITMLRESLKSLCNEGFENYDLRKFKDFQVVTDDFSCSTHVRTRMDGHWTEKLREICNFFSVHMDLQFLLNTYFTETNDMFTYLCRNNGVFRDCSSLNPQNSSISLDKNNPKLCGDLEK